MSDILNFPPFEELKTDENGRIIFPPGYPVDLLPTDEYGFIKIPAGYPNYNVPLEKNWRTAGEDLAKKVNKESPQQYSLPFASMIEGYIYYSKSDFGLALVEFRLIAKETVGVQNRTVFAQLPVGFRPVRGIYSEVNMYKKGTGEDRHGGYVVIHADGKLSLDTYTDNVNAESWSGVISFYMH